MIGQGVHVVPNSRVPKSSVHHKLKHVYFCYLIGGTLSNTPFFPIDPLNLFFLIDILCYIYFTLLAFKLYSCYIVVFYVTFFDIVNYGRTLV